MRKRIYGTPFVSLEASTEELLASEVRIGLFPKWSRTLILFVVGWLLALSTGEQRERTNERPLNERKEEKGNRYLHTHTVGVWTVMTAVLE